MPCLAAMQRQEVLSYYVNGFNLGQYTPATIMLNVLYGATQGVDLQSVNNKVTAANLFTRVIDPDLDGKDFQYNYSGNADARRARDFLLTVAWDPTTIPTEDEIMAFLVPEASATIGPAGGIVEVTNPLSPLYGAKVEIPAGALGQEATITIWTFSKSDLERETRMLKSEMRFFGGIEVDAGGAILNKSVTIYIPNSFGATSADQLLVGQVIDLDSNAPSENTYKGVAYVGSPIMFNMSNFGSFGVLSPTTPLGVISGTFVNQSGNPVPNGVIATSFSKPFVAQTNNVGYFEIPAGPAGSYAAVIGIPPVPDLTTPTGGVGLTGVQLPEILQYPPTSVIGAVNAKIIKTIIDLPEPPIPEPCPCDTAPFSSPWFTSMEYPEPPFELSPDQTIHVFLLGFGAVYGSFNLFWPNIVDLFMYPVTGSLCITTDGKYSTGNSTIATVDPITGQLTAHSEGETTINAEIQIICLKNCPGYVLPCPYHLSAVPAKVQVGISAWAVQTQPSEQSVTVGLTTCCVFLNNQPICVHGESAAPSPIGPGLLKVYKNGTSIIGYDSNGMKIMEGTIVGEAVNFKLIDFDCNFCSPNNVEVTFAGIQNGNTISGSYTGHKKSTRECCLDPYSGECQTNGGYIVVDEYDFHGTFSIQILPNF